MSISIKPPLPVICGLWVSVIVPLKIVPAGIIVPSCVTKPSCALKATLFPSAYLSDTEELEIKFTFVPLINLYVLPVGLYVGTLGISTVAVGTALGSFGKLLFSKLYSLLILSSIDVSKSTAKLAVWIKHNIKNIGEIC